MADSWGGSWGSSWATAWGGVVGVSGTGVLLAGSAAIDGAGTVSGTPTATNHGPRYIWMHHPPIDHWKE